MPNEATVVEQPRLLRPEPHLSTFQNLTGLIGAMAALTNDRRHMDKDEIKLWVRKYHDSLMVDLEGTIDDVFEAADEWVEESPFFPTIADMSKLVQRRVLARREAAMIRAAQEAAVPLPELESGEVDWSKVATRDLPPGYDYADDPHWQAGMTKLQAMHEGRSPASGLGGFVAQIDLNRRTFQGASKERRLVCPRCDGARWVRLGGWDPNDAKGKFIGTLVSRYVMCKLCCPGGQFDEVAEREAIRRAALREASVPA